MQGFSFASLILSYFLVGGGMSTGTLAIVALKPTSQIVAYALLAAGAFLGGFVAGRASRAQTILEPAIGAIAVVATIVGLAATTPIGKLIWGMAQDQTVKFIATVAATGGGGAIAGAFVSEKAFGESTTSSVPWLLYTALATFGACLLATLFASIRMIAGESQATRDEIATAMLIGMAAGCLLAGIAVGASARTRPLIAALIGGGGGGAGFIALILRAAQSGDDKDAMSVLAVFAIGGCLVTLIGTAIGWAAFGKRQAG
ncbi:MAG TPA: hypothetical protein VNO30_11965 [Kofleriaceae bacterium]|nr:hypothetical protein [Kofleriaceae bacterium]